MVCQAVIDKMTPHSSDSQEAEAPTQAAEEDEFNTTSLDVSKNPHVAKMV